MDRLQEIIRFLTAAGGTPSRDGNSTHFTYEDRASIRMRTWTGSELIDDELIADDIRPGTSAPIVNRSHKRIFVVHKDNSIKCFTDPLGDGAQVEEDEIDDDAPWNEEEIADVDTRVHPQSQLAVSYDKNTIFVFYQNPDGTLGCINEYNNQWKDVKLPTVAALAGTPLATCNTNYAVFLFYISTDRTVRYLENREGNWNDVFFSAANIIDPKAELPSSAFRLTVAEDRQPFERIRPMVFCLDNNDLSIIRFRSKKLDTIGRVEGTEFVPSLGNKERNKYYFWSPYPFYTMIKRRGKTLAQATIPKRLWTQIVRRSDPQQERGKTNAMEHLNRLQEPLIDNHSAPMVNNKTPATVSVETTNAQAIIPPQKSEQREVSSSIPAQSTIFAGFGRFTNPLHAIKRIFSTRQNEDATEEDTSENIESNDTDLALVSPEANEFEIVEVEGDTTESNGVETNISETKEVEPIEAEHLEIENVESDNLHGTEAEEALVREDRLEEADSDGTEEEAGSEGTHSEAEETAPSEVEVEMEKNDPPKVRAEETQNEELEESEEEVEEESEEEFEDEDEDAQHEEIQHEEAQTKEIQAKEDQSGEVQLEEGQTRNIQAEESQVKNPQTDDAHTNDAETEEYEAKVSKMEGAEPKEQEQKNVKREEPESEPASDKDKSPATNLSTTKSTFKPPAAKSSSTQENGQEVEIAESSIKYLDPPKASKRTEGPSVGPSVHQEKGPDTTNSAISNKSRFNTPQDIEEDMTAYIEDADLRSFFPNDSTYVPAVANTAFEYKNNEENLLNTDSDIQGITRLSLYQPVLYCDDSTSMKAKSRVSGQKERTRVDDQKDMVRRVTRISTYVVPPGHGTSLQFINFVRDIHDNKLNLLQVDAIMNSVKPKGHTDIGANLKKKILKPLVYDVIKNNKRLERPILVSCITDGCPSDKDPNTFKKEILKCIEFLEKHGYPPSTIRFQISQIGNSSRADAFLKELRDDDELSEVVYCTAQRLDDQFETFRHNELMLERWLLRTLLEPIMVQDINNLNL